MREGLKIVIVIAIFASILVIGFLLHRLDSSIGPRVPSNPEVSAPSPRISVGPGSNPISTMPIQAAQAASSPLDEVLRAELLAREEHELQVGFKSLERFPESEWNTERVKAEMGKEGRIRAFGTEKAELIQCIGGRLRALQYLRAKQAEGEAPILKPSLNPELLAHDTLEHEYALSRGRERRAGQVLLTAFPDPTWSWDRFNALSSDARVGVRPLTREEAIFMKVFDEWYRAKKYLKDSGRVPIYERVSSVILRDVQGLWGGENVWLSRDGTTYIQIVKPPKVVYPQGGLHEQRFKLNLSKEEMEVVLDLLSSNDFLYLEIKDRSGVPDEGRPTLLVHFSIGLSKSVAKWAGDKNDRFDDIYAHLRDLAKKTSDLKAIYDGRYEEAWRPEGFEAPKR